MSLTAIAGVTDTNRIRKFSGVIRYVNGTSGSDSNSGLTPLQPLATIGAAIAASSAGDAINVFAGTYTEVGLDVDVNALEVWFEIGTIIDPASGTALTISGDFVKTTGEHTITPAAGEVGKLITGSNCHTSNCKVSGGGVGVRVTGASVVIDDYACGNQTSIGYDLQGGSARLRDCSTKGAGATIGYKISGGADTGVLRRCTSVGHQTAGYYIDTGSQDWTILNCSSGRGDGRWVDVDSANTWSGFEFTETKFHELTFDASGPTSVNLFRAYGSVSIEAFFAHVETVLSGDIGNGYLELDDGTNQIDVTDSPGPSFNSLPVGSYVHKIDDNAVNLNIENSSQVRLYEDATKFGRDPTFQITAKNGVATYLRFTYSGAGTSGALHFHCRWKPLSDDGFLAEV